MININNLIGKYNEIIENYPIKYIIIRNLIASYIYALFLNIMPCICKCGSFGVITHLWALGFFFYLWGNLMWKITQIYP